jgi:hypothetical protein
MSENTDAIQRQIESDLLAAGFPPALALDTAWYASHCENEDAARLYRFSHTDTFLDDLDWETARRYWTARTGHTAQSLTRRTPGPRPHTGRPPAQLRRTLSQQTTPPEVGPSPHPLIPTLLLRCLYAPNRSNSRAPDRAPADAH